MSKAGGLTSVAGCGALVDASSLGSLSQLQGESGAPKTWIELCPLARLEAQ